MSIEAATMSRRMMTRALALAALGLAAPGLAGSARRRAGRLEKYANFPSKLVAPRNVTLWLPEGYDPAGKPYSVLYMHDGQNLFEEATAYGGTSWGVAEALSRLTAANQVRPTVVVGVWNTPARLREYMPARVFGRLPAAYRERVGSLYQGKPLSDAYLRFIVTELKPFIDRTYNVSRGARDTAIMGSSMGGLISLYALLEYPRVFGGAGCVSSHWPLLLPPDGQSLAAEDVTAVSGAFESYLRSALPRPGTHRLWFDHGDQTLDRLYAPFQARVDRVVAAAGWRRGRDWESKVYPGAAHNEASWRARLAEPLSFLLPAPAR